MNDYWREKSQRAHRAQKQTLRFQEKYYEDISESVRLTTIYETTSLGNTVHNKEKNTRIIVKDMTSKDAIFNYFNNNKLAVLNFASYKKPGGEFINGSIAQEESLCHGSCLYNVLVKFDETYYKLNKKNLNKSMYTNRALYSPKVLFKDDLLNQCKVDVITCAAPNKRASSRFKLITNDDNSIILQSRIDFVLNIASKEKVDTLILGAFGCGVFGQSAEEVSSIFKELLETKYKGCFDLVVFAVPKSSKCFGNDNYTIFKNTFEMRGND